MSLPAAVLFDMDGTLIDSEGLWLDAEIAVMAGLGSTWSEADQEHCLGGPLERVADYMIERSGASRHDGGRRRAAPRRHGAATAGKHRSPGVRARRPCFARRATSGSPPRWCRPRGRG